MSEQTQKILVAIGVVVILYGVVRLIFLNHRSPDNVNLVGWMFTGGLVELVTGLFKGSVNIFRLYLDSNAKAALAVYFGIAIVILAL